MELTQAITLGVVQGVTEFLPISSDGHLALFQSLMNHTENIVIFDVMLHFATLISIVVFFRSDIISIKKSTLPLIILGTIPAVIFGLWINPLIESLYTSLFVVSLGFMSTGIILISTKFIRQKEPNPLTSTKSLLIGIAQAFAILPGVSRSGTTVSLSLYLGLDRHQAFSFSFILAIPAILGATLLKVTEAGNVQLINFEYLAGMIAATLTGLVSLQILKVVINRAALHHFGIYCLVLSGVTLALALNQI